MDARRILVSDLDGTLLGDDGALRRFRDWLGDRRDGYRVVYASGRRIESVLGLVEEGTLPAADAVISSVGTEVFDGVGGVWAGWGDGFEEWDADLVRETLRPLRWLEPQPDADQSPRKASYDVWGLTPSDQATIRQKLAEAGLVVELVYSGGRYLDLLPDTCRQGPRRPVPRRWLGDRRRRRACVRRFRERCATARVRVPRHDRGQCPA